MSLEFIMTILAASVLGSTHCAGMCGPFAALVVGAHRGSHVQLAFRLGAYHLGRLATYLLLGFLAGLVGGSLNLAGELWGLQRLAAYLAGTAMLITAFILLLRQRGFHIQHLPVPRAWTKTIHSAFRAAARWPWLSRALAIGFLTTWIPCGWLYAFVIVAAGSGNPPSALAIMTAFWCGTVPLLAFLGWSCSNILPRSRVALSWISIAACLALGLFTILSRSTVHLRSLNHQLAGAGSLEDRLHLVERAKFPCCHDD
jgi:hypothetical protein